LAPRRPPPFRALATARVHRDRLSDRLRPLPTFFVWTKGAQFALAPIISKYF
jgi:hypothetical protein